MARRSGTVHSGGLQKHHELVAADASYCVGFAHAAAQPLSHLCEIAVADMVSLGVVQRLEIVEVDEEQGAAFVFLAARIDRRFEPVEEKPAVGQAGQRIEIG